MSRISDYRNRKPKNVIKYVTVELYHPDSGIYRFVTNQFTDKVFTLESGAARNAGEAVTFQPAAFEYTSPSQSTEPSVSASISMQRVGSDIKRAIKKLSGFAGFTPIDFVWREFLSDDTSEPVVVYYLYVNDITPSRDSFTISAGDTNPLVQSVSRIATPADFNGMIDL